MTQEVLIVVLVAFNTLGCVLGVWFFSRKVSESASLMQNATQDAIVAVKADKKELLKLLEQCQNRITAKSLTDFSALEGITNPDPEPSYRDRSDRGEAEIAETRLFSNSPDAYYSSGEQQE